MNIETQGKQARAFLVGLEIKRAPAVLDIESSLMELAMLADTAGIHVVGQATQKVQHPDPATFIRKGKVEEVAQWVEELDANMVLFDDELTPRHQRELEKIFDEEIRVLDRTELILDIFAQHARTREGALQVELAQYEYRLPRLTRQWTHLVRQAGGGAARGGAGGVGLRGPGETQLETDRREINRKISYLKRQIEDVRAHRERHRAQRKRSGIPLVSFVGYTNAGKSTLLNCLSDSSVYVADQLFATLDPTTRRVVIPDGREVLFTDTVGFIQKLPHSLIAAFRATLEEIESSDLLIHIIDASHTNAVEHAKTVQNTLHNDLSTENIPMLVVLNKLDLAEDIHQDVLKQLTDMHQASVQISALTGMGIDSLLQSVGQSLSVEERNIIIQVPYSEGATIASFYENARNVTEAHGDDHVTLEGYVHNRFLAKFKPYIIR